MPGKPRRCWYPMNGITKRFIWIDIKFSNFTGITHSVTNIFCYQPDAQWNTFRKPMNMPKDCHLSALYWITQAVFTLHVRRTCAPYKCTAYMYDSVNIQRTCTSYMCAVSNMLKTTTYPSWHPRKKGVARAVRGHAHTCTAYVYGVHIRRTCTPCMYVVHVRGNTCTSHMHNVHVRQCKHSCNMYAVRVW